MHRNDYMNNQRQNSQLYLKISRLITREVFSWFLNGQYSNERGSRIVDRIQYVEHVFVPLIVTFVCFIFM